MFFQPTRYMEFAKRLDLSSIECNLAFSGVICPYSLTELGITVEILNKVPFEPYGNGALKAALAERYNVHPDQVFTPGGGTSLANFIIAGALLGPGDWALVENPTYECLQATIASTGAEIVTLSRPAENKYKLDLAECDSLMRPPVKLVAVTRLHNPTGRDLPIDTLLYLAEKADQIGAYVLVDEVYLDFLPSERIQVAAALHPRLLSTASLTKVYGLGDLRVGWAFGPPELIQQCWRINNVLGVNPPMIPDQIALQLFRNGALDRLQRWTQQRSQAHLPILEQFVSNRKDLSWVKPEGGIFAFLRLTEGKEADSLVQLLREKYRTQVMPGSHFGQPDGFRLGFGGPETELREGLRRLDLALEEWRS